MTGAADPASCGGVELQPSFWERVTTRGRSVHKEASQVSSEKKQVKFDVKIHVRNGLSSSCNDKLIAQKKNQRICKTNSKETRMFQIRHAARQRRKKKKRENRFSSVMNVSGASTTRFFGGRGSPNQSELTKNIRIKKKLQIAPWPWTFFFKKKTHKATYARIARIVRIVRHSSPTSQPGSC